MRTSDETEKQEISYWNCIIAPKREWSNVCTSDDPNHKQPGLLCDSLSEIGCL